MVMVIWLWLKGAKFDRSFVIHSCPSTILYEFFAVLGTFHRDIIGHRMVQSRVYTLHQLVDQELRFGLPSATVTILRVVVIISF